MVQNADLASTKSLYRFKNDTFYILQYDQITLYTLQGKNSKPNTLKVKTFLD